MTTRYVSTKGSDSNTGSLASPLRTLGGAVARSAAGDTIIFAGGTYTGAWINKAVTITQLDATQPVLFTDANRVQVIAFDGVSGGGIVGLGSLTVGRPKPASTLDNQTQNVSVQTNNCTGMHFLNFTAESHADAGLRLAMSATGAAITIDGVTVQHNGEGIRIHGNGTRSVDPVHAPVQLSGCQYLDNDRMVVDGQYGGVGLVLDACANVSDYRGLYRRNHAATIASYGTDGGAIEIYGAVDCSVIGPDIADCEGVCETGTASDKPSPHGNVIRDGWVSGSYNPTPRSISPAFLLRASRSMTISGMLIAAHGRSDVFRWNMDSWADGWENSSVKGNVIDALDGQTIYQTYGNSLVGVTTGNIVWPGPASAPGDYAVDPYSAPYEAWALLAQIMDR